MNEMNRREALGTMAAGATAFTAAINSSESHAQQANKNITEIIASKPLTDQYGKPFKPTDIFKDKSYIVIEGFLHCQGQCPRIRANVGDIRAALEDKADELARSGDADKSEALRKLPVLWIDVMPDAKDYQSFLPSARGDRQEPEECLAEAYRRGLWQDPAHAKNFPDNIEERTKLAAEAFKNGDPNKPSERLLHVAFPQSHLAATELQKAMGVHFNKVDPQSHGSRIALVGHDGKTLAAPSGLVTDANQKNALKEAIVDAAVKAVTAQLEAAKKGKVRD